MGNERKIEEQKGIIFVADHWGEYIGGIDVFNQKLCEAMAYVVEQPKVRIVCLILGTVKNIRIKQYAKRGITIIPYDISETEKKSHDYTQVLEEVKDQLQNMGLIWIGHDIKTGEEALAMARERREKCAIIFHTNYRVMHRDRGDDIPYEAELTDRQSRLAREADWVFCVGTALNQCFVNLREGTSAIIPGIEEKYKCVKNNEIVIGGRFTKRNTEQKNWERAWVAVVDALNSKRIIYNNPSEFEVFVYGFSEYTDEELEKMRSETAERISNENKWTIKPRIHLKKFDQNRDRYLNNLAGSKLFIMSSARESFGLAAWEALSSEVPVVLPRNSGIYKYLENELGYLLNGLCGSFEMSNIEEQMISNMSDSIVDIIVNMDKMEKSTRLLRKEMSKNTWELSAIKIANKIGISEVMDAAIFEDSDYAEFTYEKRKNMFDELKRRFRNEQIEKKVVFFGGISKEEILDDDEFLLIMLKRMCSPENRDSAIFICYETEDAIQQRAIQLEDGNEKILFQKANSIAGIKKRLSNLCSKPEHNFDKHLNVKKGLERIYLIELKKCPSVYINIVDDDWYFTTTFENRSTQNATVKLAKTKAGEKQKQRLLTHMRFILNGIENEGSSLLLTAMKQWEEESITWIKRNSW